MATIHDPIMTTTNATKYLIPVYYNKKFIDRLVPNLRWTQLCDTASLPKNSGIVCKWSAYKSLAVASRVTSLGTKPTPVVLSTYNVTATVRNYCSYAAIERILDESAVSPVVEQAIDVIAEQAALTIDTYIRNCAFGYGFPSATSRISAAARDRHIGSVSRLSALHNKVYGFTVKLVASLSSGVTKNLSGATAVTGVSAWKNYIHTLRDIRSGVTFLRQNNAKPMSNEQYIAIGTPQAMSQIMGDVGTTGWADWNKYTTPQTTMYKGKIGDAEGCTFISSTNAMQRALNTGGTLSATFITIVGKGALGCIDYDNLIDKQMEGGSMPQAVIVKRANQYNTDDPCNQVKATVGFNIGIAAAILNMSCGVHVMALATPL